MNAASAGFVPFVDAHRENTDRVVKLTATEKLIVSYQNGKYVIQAESNISRGSG